MLPGLSHEEILRYSRHLLIPEVGLEGQRKLKAASVLVIGTGGLDRRCACTWRRPELGGLAWWITMWSITQTCSAR